MGNLLYHLLRDVPGHAICFGGHHQCQCGAHLHDLIQNSKALLFQVVNGRFSVVLLAIVLIAAYDYYIRATGQFGI